MNEEVARQLEGSYHFILSDMLDLIRQYGYCNVINDLDSMIEEEINNKLVVINKDWMSDAL